MTISNPNNDYYHINRDVPWASKPLLVVGDVIDIGGESNPYFKYFEEQRKLYHVTNSSDGSILDVPGVKYLSAVKNGEITSSNLPAIAHEMATHFVTYIRELIWEDVRKKEFPHLPSRQRCIWLIPNIEGVRYWVRRLESEDQVVRVKTQGRLHKASESFLLGDSEPMNLTIQKARQYWLGVVEQVGTEEIIFEGRITVEEIIDPAVYA